MQNIYFSIFILYSFIGFSQKREVKDTTKTSNTFGESATPSELMKKYKIDSDAVIEAVERVLKRK